VEESLLYQTLVKMKPYQSIIFPSNSSYPSIRIQRIPIFEEMYWLAEINDDTNHSKQVYLSPDVNCTLQFLSPIRSLKNFTEFFL
jgi:hypothetical protein